MSEYTIQKLPPLSTGARPETGPMQFGDDWPGVFFRGDNALFFALALDQAIAHLPQEAWPARFQLQGLRDDLRSCSVGDTGWPPVRKVE